MSRAPSNPERGATLVELVVSIVIISIALAGVLVAMDRNTRASADPMVLDQSVAIAEAYLEEILAKDFVDPDGTNVGETRATYDDVFDYNGLPDTVVRDQNGTAIVPLSAYAVAVQVANNNVNGLAAALVTVTVTPPFGNSLVLSGYRTNYEP